MKDGDRVDGNSLSENQDKGDWTPESEDGVDDKEDWNPEDICYSGSVSED